MGLDSVVVVQNPIQDLRPHEADVGLNANVGNQAALDVGIDRLHVNSQETFHLPRGQQFGHFLVAGNGWTGFDCGL